MILPPNYNGIAVSPKTHAIKLQRTTDVIHIQRPPNYTAYAEAVLKDRHVPTHFLDWWYKHIADADFKKWYDHDTFRNVPYIQKNNVNAFGHWTGAKFTQFNILIRNSSGRTESFALASNKTFEYVDGLITQYTDYVQRLNKDNPGIAPDF